MGNKEKNLVETDVKEIVEEKEKILKFIFDIFENLCVFMDNYRTNGVHKYKIRKVKLNAKYINKRNIRINNKGIRRSYWYVGSISNYCDMFNHYTY